MAVPLLLLLLLAMFTSSEGAFCVCKPGVPDAMMQKAIDYACGKGADCTQTMQNGPCYSTQKAVVCSYIVNSYYQKNGPMGGTCDFGGVATLTTTDPSSGNCRFASGSSGGGGGMGGGGAGTGGGMGGGGAGAGTGGGGAGAGTGGGMGGAGAGTGAGTGAAGSGAGAGAGTGMGGTGGAGAGMTTPGSTLSPPFGNAYGPSGVGTGPDYNAAAARLPVLASAAVMAAAPLILRFIY